MASLIKKCELCNKEFNYTSGHFTLHLKSEHNLSLKDYIIKFEYNNLSPKCKCGYCNEDAPFIRGIFLNFIVGHNTYKWRNEQYITNNGQPTCKTCGTEIGFNRDTPLKYCSRTCMPNRWNLEKCKKSLKHNHGVNNPMELESVRTKVGIKNKKNSKTSLKKRIQTVKERYGVESVMHLESSKKTLRNTMFKKYGVEYALQNKDIHLKQQQNSFKLKKFKLTELYYQSTYELDFLKLCENHNIIDNVKNGNRYSYDNHFYFTDFSIDDYEIEIKSTWILKKQGGIKVLNKKRKAVESANKQYIFILDKDYSEFLEILKL